MDRTWRYVALVSTLVVVLLAGCGQAAAPSPSSAGQPSQKATEKPSEKPTASPSQKPEAKKAPTKVRYGWVPNPVLAREYLSQDKGWFKDEGLDVEFVKFQGGAPMLEAAFGGSVDMGGLAFTSVVMAAAQGKMVKVVTSGADVGQYKGKIYGLHGLMAPLDSKIRDDTPEHTLQDLVGKTVAVPTRQSPDWVLLAIRLKNAGIDPGKVNTVEMPWPAMPAALASKSVDAAVVVEPFRTVVLAEKMAKDLGDAVLGDAKWGAIAGDKLLPQAVTFSTVDFINKNPDAVQAFVRAMGKANDFINDPANKSAVTETIAKWTGVPAPVLAGMKEFPYVRRDNGFVDDSSGLQYLADLWLQNGFIDKPINVKDMVSIPWYKGR